MKKHLLIALALMASCFGMNAQQTWFPTKEGTVLTYANYDAKGKLTSTDVNKIISVTKDGAKTTIEYEIEVFDDKGNTTGVVIPAKVWTADGYYHIDAKSTLNGAINLDNVTIKGHAPILPENPKNGETLEDCHVSIETLFMDFDWSDIKVSTGQTVTTKAGTYNDAVLLEYNTLSKVAIIKVQSSAKEWYVKGVGLVKNEMYTNKGKLSSSKELVSVEN